MLEASRLQRVTKTMPCPQCRTAVNPGVAKCVHCNAALLTKPCRDCGELAYVGHVECPHCKVSFARAAAAAAPSAAQRACPRCQSLMAAQTVAGGTLENCHGCGGTYLDATLLETMLGDVQRRHFDRVELVASAAPQLLNPSNPGASYVKCPDCRTIMNRRQFAHGAGVVLDGCKGHGTFFDAGELRKVVDFMKSGGLEKAAAIEQQRLATQKRDDARKRAEARAAVSAVVPGMSDIEPRGDSLLADVVLSLFW